MFSLQDFLKTCFLKEMKLFSLFPFLLLILRVDTVDTEVNNIALCVICLLEKEGNVTFFLLI